MKRLAFIKSVFVVIAFVFAASLISSCDGDCYEGGNDIKKSTIEKAAPGTQPNEEKTDEC